MKYGVLKESAEHYYNGNKVSKGAGIIPVTDNSAEAFNDKFEFIADEKKEVEQYLGLIEQKDKKEDSEKVDNFDDLPDDIEFPYHKGAGYYFLSDGTQVRGKKAAKEKQIEIDKEK